MKRRKQMLAAVLASAVMLSSMSFGASALEFSDTEGHWAASSVSRWSDYGIVQGAAGKFNPDAPMTRAEMATMLANLLGLKDKADNTFADVKSGAWYEDAILKCAKAGIIEGTGSGADPEGRITREQAAVMLGRALGIAPATGTASFNDGAQVADWAAGYVKALADKGIVNGVSEGAFGPKLEINRASVATILDRSITTYANKPGESVEASGTGITLVAAANVTITGTAADVLVAPGAADGAVTLKDAKVTGTVTVDAAGASLALDGKSEVASVAVSEQAAAAKVTVGADAKATSVTVAAPKAKVTVSGTAGTVSVDDNAAGAAVDVAKDAKVDTLTVGAESTDVTVAGSVKSVDVADSAAGAAVTVEKGATVSNMTSAADNVKVDGAGKVSNLTVTGGKGTTVAKETTVTKVENKGDSSVKVGDKDVKPDSSTGSSNSGTSSGGSSGNSNRRQASNIGNVSKDIADVNWEGYQKGAMKTLDYASSGTTVKAVGSLAQVTGFTGFNSTVTDEQSGYYATVRVVVADADAKKALAATGTIVTVTGTKTKTFTAADKIIEGNEGNYYIDLILRVASLTDTSAKNYTMTADWDGDENSNSSTTYQATTYTLDFSGVQLLPAGFSVPTVAKISNSNWDGITEDNVSLVAGYDAVVLAGKTIKLTGSVPYYENFTAFDGRDGFNSGNFVGFVLNYDEIPVGTVLKIRSEDAAIGTGNAETITADYKTPWFVYRITDENKNACIDVFAGADAETLLFTYTVDVSGLTLRLATDIVNEKTLLAAIAAAESGATIKLSENVAVTKSVEIPENKEITLDLNGKTLSTSSNKENILNVKGTLTINGAENSELKTTGDESHAITVFEGGMLVANDVKITNAYAEYTNFGVLHIEGKAEINNCEISGQYGVAVIGPKCDAALTNCDVTSKYIPVAANGGTAYAGYKLTIDGGSFISDDTGIYLPSAGTVEIKGYASIESNGKELTAGENNAAAIGIEIRAGKLTLGNDVTVTCNYAQNESATQVNGATGKFTGPIVVGKPMGASNAAGYDGDIEVNLGNATLANSVENGDLVAVNVMNLGSYTIKLDISGVVEAQLEKIRVKTSEGFKTIQDTVGDISVTFPAPVEE